MASTSSVICRKRLNEEISSSGFEGNLDGPPAKRFYYFVLESESDISSDEPPESVHSIQDKTTASPKDTSDTSSKDSDFAGSEYEVMSLDENEQQTPFDKNDSFSSGNDTEMLKGVAITPFCEQGEDLAIWADSSSTSSESDEIDSELSPADFWKCVQCRNTNNNPMFRYCEKCFKVRKNFFPTRPRGKKKRRVRHKTKMKTRGNTLSTNVDCKNDSGLGSSQNVLSSFENSEKLNILSQPSTSSDVNKSFESSSQNVPSSFGNSEKVNILSQPSTSSDVNKSFESSSQNVLSSFENSEKVNILSQPSTSSDINRSFESCDLDSLSQPSTSSEKRLNEPVHQEALCNTCLIKAKDGIFVHGAWAHIYSCYECSKKIWRTTGRCPICNAKVSQVLKGVIAY